MLTQEQINNKFESLGVNKENIAKYTEDVYSVIMHRLAEKRLSSLPEELIRHPPNTSEAWKTELEKLHIPPFSDEEIDEVVEQTWREYFKALKK